MKKAVEIVDDDLNVTDLPNTASFFMGVFTCIPRDEFWYF